MERTVSRETCSKNKSKMFHVKQKHYVLFTCYVKHDRCVNSYNVSSEKIPFVVAAFHIGHVVARPVRATRLYVVQPYPGKWPIL